MDKIKFNQISYIHYRKLRVSKANDVPISSLMYIGSLDEFETALKPLKNAEKIEINFHEHFRNSLNI